MFIHPVLCWISIVLCQTLISISSGIEISFKKEMSEGIRELELKQGQVMGARESGFRPESFLNLELMEQEGRIHPVYHY